MPNTLYYLLFPMGYFFIWDSSGSRDSAWLPRNDMPDFSREMIIAENDSDVSSRIQRKKFDMPDYWQAVRELLDLKDLWLDVRETADDILHRLAKTHPDLPLQTLAANFREALQKEKISI